MRKLIRYYWIVRTCLVRFKSLGKKSCVIKPIQIDNPEGIALGHNVYVGHYSWIMGTKSPKELGLNIMDDVVIGHFAHIIADKHVVIEKNVLIADRVFISDCTHDYSLISKPIKNQKVKFIKPVYIGENTWLGENVVVCGACIGKNCVIGANSVVVNDIPDYCVAVGSPARIIKKYDFKSGKWVLVN